MYVAQRLPRLRNHFPLTSSKIKVLGLCTVFFANLLKTLGSSSKFLMINKINVFKVPEAPKKITPEKKESVPVPEEPEAPPASGTWCSLYLGKMTTASSLCLS